MTHELCILFSYHADDELTLRHYRELRRSNPAYPIVPLVDEDLATYLPDSVDVRKLPDRWPAAKPWRRCDTKLYRWFENRSLDARRYVLLEYDCLVTVDLAHAYREIWDADVAARDYFLPGDRSDTREGESTGKEWYFFREVRSLDREDRPHAAGLVPLACTFFSHRGLERIVANLTRRDVFCELRLGTAARKAGLTVTRFPESLRATVRWDPIVPPASPAGVYHAVKTEPRSSR
jgi:hypothetical protein